MTQPIYLEGEYPMRCPWCGDSRRHPNKAHLSINVQKGLFHCFRCGRGGKLSFEQMTQIPDLLDSMLSLPPERKTTTDALKEIQIRLLEGPGTSRPSGLSRYHLPSEHGPIDVFLSLDLEGDVVGYHLRKIKPTKFSMTIGARALGYSPLNSFTSFLRLVEGPYDVMDPLHDICLFGMPSRYQVQKLSRWPLVPCPDSDIWEDPKKLQSYQLILSPRTKIIPWVEVLPAGKDPDEVPISDRKRVLPSLCFKNSPERKPFI